MVSSPLMVVKTRDKIYIGPIVKDFEDDFTMVHLPGYSAKKRGVTNIPITFDKVYHKDKFDEFTKFISKVNLFKPRVEVPDKPVYFEVRGESKLLRDRSTGTIKLVYREKGGPTTDGGRAMSANTCYITTQQSFDFYHSAYSDGYHNYYMTPDHPNYDYWDNYMDKAYAELAGTKYENKFTKPGKPNQSVDQRESAEQAYAWSRPGFDLDIIKEMARRGLCKIDNSENFIYDKNGYFICEAGEAKEKEGSGEIILKLLDWLDDQDLYDFRRIMDNYLEGF